MTINFFYYKENRRIIIESDSSVVMKWIKGEDRPNSIIRNIVDACLHELRNFEDFEICHIWSKESKSETRTFWPSNLSFTNLDYDSMKACRIPSWRRSMMIRQEFTGLEESRSLSSNVEPRGLPPHLFKKINFFYLLVIVN